MALADKIGHEQLQKYRIVMNDGIIADREYVREWLLESIINNLENAEVIMPSQEQRLLYLAITAAILRENLQEETPLVYFSLEDILKEFHRIEEEKFNPKSYPDTDAFVEMALSVITEIKKSYKMPKKISNENTIKAYIRDALGCLTKKDGRFLVTLSADSLTKIFRPQLSKERHTYYYVFSKRLVENSSEINSAYDFLARK